MSIATLKRRRKQMRNGNRHLAKMGRPGVPKRVSESKASAREARKIAKANAMRSRKGSK